MRVLLLVFLLNICIHAIEVFKYSLHDLALIVSDTNNINIIIDDKIENEKIFFFNDPLDKILSFETFVYMLKDINYEISFNGKFYHVTKDDSSLHKYFFAPNPNFTREQLSLLSQTFNVDLSLSNSSQIVVKYLNRTDLQNLNTYLQNYKPLKHVHLDGEIIAVNETALKDIGIDFSSIASTIKDTGTFDISLFSNINNNDAVKSIISSQGLNAFGDISVFVSLLEATGFSTVVTKPNMIIRSGSVSTFNSGKQIRIITGSTESIRNSGEYSSKQYEILDLGLSLECSANIYNDDTIDLDFSFSVKDIQVYEPQLDQLILDNKSFKSQFTLKNNDTVLIAGLTSTVDKTDIHSVPFFSDIPFFGSFFEHEINNSNSISYLIYFKAVIK